MGLHPDVETIVTTAMCKAMTARYPSAADFSADCRRWLAGERVHARPPRATERARMLMARHRQKLMALALAAAVAAGVGATLLAQRLLE